MKISIASDHRGVEKKKHIIETLNDHSWTDHGPTTPDSVDYPDFAIKVAQDVSEGTVDRGVLLCGSGIGMSIAANKVNGIRAALIDTVSAAKGTREHNDSNVLCLSADRHSPEEIIEITRTWLDTDFSQDERHMRRIQKIHDLEKKGQ